MYRVTGKYGGRDLVEYTLKDLSKITGVVIAENPPFGVLLYCPDTNTNIFVAYKDVASEIVEPSNNENVLYENHTLPDDEDIDITEKVGHPPLARTNTIKYDDSINDDDDADRI